jgi:hypothetical protein
LKVAILTNRADSFYRPLAEGLNRMFKQIGVDSLLLYDGLSSLPRKQNPHQLRSSNWKGELYWFVNNVLSRKAYRCLLRDLHAVDLAVIVGHMPVAYLESLFDDTRLRRDAPHLPIVLYDLVYLPTRGSWPRWLLENKPGKHITDGQHWGLNRYDYHLCVTEVSEHPVPSGAESYSRIGVDLIDPSLAVEPKEPIALIDFERPDHLHERAIQIMACIEAGIPFKVLHRHYSIEEIRSIYRSCSFYFVAHRESFGLPICEVQTCGGMILTPYARWCPSHYLERPDDNREGRLPSNFIVYNNDKQQLVRELQRLKRVFNAQQVFVSFQQEQPHFYRGNIEELQRFVGLVKDGTVNPRSHRNNLNLHQLVRAINTRPSEIDDNLDLN